MHVCSRLTMLRGAMQATNSFAVAIKDIRTQLGLSQEDLARALGVSFATVNRWENGKTSPSKLARGSFVAYCNRMIKEGRLKHAPL